MAARKPPKPQKKPPVFHNKQWQACYDHYLQSIENLSGSVRSRIVYDGILRAFFRDPKRTPDTYTQADVIAFISRPTEGYSSHNTPPKPGTRNGRLVKLKSFYKFASHYRVDFRNGRRPILHTENPTEFVKMAETQSAKKTLTDDEIARFFAVIPTTSVQGLRDRCIFLLCFWCGRRQTAALSLRYGDLERTTFHESGLLRQGWIYHFREKGGKRGFAELPTPVVEALDVYLEASGRKPHMTAESPLFVGTKNCDPSQPLDGRTADFLFRKYARLAGIRPGHSMHSFRHTIARIRYEEERDLLRVMRFLGHSDPKTTLNYLSGIVYEADTTAQRLYSKYSHL